MGASSEEIEGLAEEILADIELSRTPLNVVMLKCSRLARFLADDENLTLFRYEAGGYPSSPDGVDAHAFELGRKSGRVRKVEHKGEVSERMDTSSVETLEQQLEAAKLALAAATDRDVSVASANPTQFVMAPPGNANERRVHATNITEIAKKISMSRAYAHEYAAAALYQIRFSNVASTFFDRVRNDIDRKMVELIPAGIQKTSSITDNLRSDNPEDWANAVHSCRRLLQDLADALFPPQEPRVKGSKSIHLGPDNYINRLVCYIEDKKGSGRYSEIVGSTLAYIGERLDSVFKAAQKGSHAQIESREEAERYVIYTFLTVGDIMAL
ncbi:MAG: hypothetical protein JO276_00600 [Sphingomonadaceae bacterium]|nr:hypothetical protein [Sphingomonadaceae bacterium]